MENARTKAISLKLARDRSRRYTPFALFGFAIFLTATILPSALNLPVSNPSQTLEYAPVPSDEDAAPPGGNLSSLGLGSGRGFGQPQEQLEGDNIVTPGRGARPSGKRCVGNPPRQTEDPMSPPCVAFFEGNNFGSTHAGVTKDEIRVVVVYKNGFLNNGDGAETGPTRNGQFVDFGYCDTENPQQDPEACSAEGGARESTYVKWTKAFARYFNDRYQTYGRRVHFWVYWTASSTPEQRRAQAADIYSRIRPFAVFDQSLVAGNDNVFYEELAKRGVVVVIGGYKARHRASFFNDFAPHVWSFNPDAERSVSQYVSYVCKRVAPFPVAHAEGGVGRDRQPMNGRPRKYAFLSTTDPAFIGHQHFAALARSQLDKCGVKAAVDLTYRIEGPFPRAEADLRQRALENVAAMQQQDVTTVIYLGGTDLNTGEAADQVRYYPEVIFAGDGELERNYRARFQNQNWFRNAWGISHQRFAVRLEDDWGWKACKEGDSQLTKGNCGFASAFYTDYFMLFKAIQVAGPRLTPQSIDRGLHAIPPISSSGPHQASCFYDPGDFSCVKDATEEWWDPVGQVAGSATPGCFRTMKSGFRYRAQEWAEGDEVFGSAPCNSYSGGGSLDQ